MTTPQTPPPDAVGRQLAAPAMPQRDVWIDGKAYPVPQPVFGYVAHLETLNSQLVARLAAAEANVQLLGCGMPAMPGSGRWTAKIKAEVVVGIRCGLIDRAKALELYQLSEPELQEWERDHGRG